MNDRPIGGAAYRALAVPDAGQASSTDAPGADGAARAPAGGNDGRWRGVELERRRGDAVGHGWAGRVLNAELVRPGG